MKKKLTNADARFIRRWLDDSPDTGLLDVAHKFGVAQSTVSYIARGLTYTNTYPRRCKVWKPRSGAAMPVGKVIKAKFTGASAPAFESAYDNKFSDDTLAKTYEYKDNPVSVAIETLKDHGFPSSTMYEMFYDGNFTTCVIRRGKKLVVGTTKRNTIDPYDQALAVRLSVGRAAKKLKGASY